MPRVIQKKKNKGIDFDIILKIFFSLLALAILVLVVIKVVERIDKSKDVDPLFPNSDFQSSFIRNAYTDGLDGFFADEEFANMEPHGHEGAVFIFVYNSNTDVYIDTTVEDEDKQNELKNFIKEDFNKELTGVQSYYQLATEYIEKLNIGGKKVIYLLDLYGNDYFYGNTIPKTSLTLAADTLAVCQISYQTSTTNELDRTKVFLFNKDGYGAQHTALNQILGEIAQK